jgi:hypothetical protein
MVKFRKVTHKYNPKSISAKYRVYSTAVMQKHAKKTEYKQSIQQRVYEAAIESLHLMLCVPLD